MKKLFTLFVLLTMFMGAKAVTIVDAEVDFSKYTDISQVPRFSWGGAQEAWDRLSIVDGCLHWHSTEIPVGTNPDDANTYGKETTWLAQWFPIGMADPAEVGVTYTLHFKVKGDHAENISAIGFGLTPYGQFPITTDWVEGTYDYVATGTDGNLLFQAGGYVGDFDIAYLKITHDGKVERPATWIELIENGNAEKSWADLGLDEMGAGDDENYKVCLWAKERDNHPADDGGFATFPAHIIEEPGNASNHVFWLETPAATTDGDASAWDSQLWLQSPRAWKKGETFKLSFRYKADVAVTTGTQFHDQHPGDYLHWQAIGDINFTTEWQTFEKEVTVPDNEKGLPIWSIAFNLNSSSKEPMNFYIDDLSWSEMQLDHGLFLAGKNSETGTDYDYDTAVEFADAGDGLVSATFGTVGNKETWVNELQISTVRGNDKQFKANTIKPKGAVKTSDPDEYFDYEEAASAKVELPAQGVWTVYIDTEAKVMSFEQVEGDEIPVFEDIVENPTHVVIEAEERDYTAAEAPEGYEFPKNEKGEDITGQPWDAQFIIMANRPLKAGEKTIISFKYKADNEVTIGTQCGGSEPGAYVWWNCIGEVNFTTEEQNFEKEFTIPADADGMQSITFNLAVKKNPGTFEIWDVIWKTESERTLINMKDDSSFYVKKAAGTNPTGITNVVENKIQSNVIYNIAGQRVSGNYKGIVIKNGAKYVVK